MPLKPPIGFSQAKYLKTKMKTITSMIKLCKIITLYLTFFIYFLSNYLKSNYTFYVTFNICYILTLKFHIYFNLLIFFSRVILVDKI